MKTLTITVPDEMDEEVGAWEDGQPYTLNVVQTGEGTFDLESVGEPEAETPEETAAPEEEAEPAMSPGMSALARSQK